MSIEKLGQCFGAIEDPRCGGKVEHRLVDILVIAVRAVIACAESWDDIALYGRSKLAWLSTFLDLPNGIPSHDTFRRVFMLIDPDAFEAGFAAWVGSLAAGFEREVVAIDGKTLRRSFDHGREQSALHMVSAWAKLVKVPVAQRLEYQRRAASRASCWASAAWMTSPTRYGCPRAAGSARTGEQHRHLGRDELPHRDCRAHPGARRRLPAHPQDQPSAAGVERQYAGQLTPVSLRPQSEQRDRGSRTATVQNNVAI